MSQVNHFYRCKNITLELKTQNQARIKILNSLKSYISINYSKINRKTILKNFHNQREEDSKMGYPWGKEVRDADHV